MKAKKMLRVIYVIVMVAFVTCLYGAYFLFTLATLSAGEGLTVGVVSAGIVATLIYGFFVYVIIVDSGSTQRRIYWRPRVTSFASMEMQLALIVFLIALVAAVFLFGGDIDQAMRSLKS